MSYQNQHSLTLPYWNFLPFPFIFYPHEICLIVAFVFIQLTYNNTLRNVFLKEKKKQLKHEGISSTKEELTISNQQQKSKFVACL